MEILYSDREKLYLAHRMIGRVGLPGGIKGDPVPFVSGMGGSLGVPALIP